MKNKQNIDVEQKKKHALIFVIRFDDLSDNRRKKNDMPSTGNNVPRKEGELLKYKNIFSGWAKRYFRLDRTYLHYFEYKHDHESLSTITRGEIVEVRTNTNIPDKENVFDIVLKNGTIWYCQASTPQEMVQWMQALSPVPFVLDPSNYETTALDSSFEMIQPSYNPNFPPLPPGTLNFNNNPSPYQDIHNQAHQEAYNQGYSGDCPNTPPPPYSEQDSTPKFPSQYPS